MISKDTAIVIGAGALSGIMYASLKTGHPILLLLVFFSLLPLFTVGLAYGVNSLLVAVVAGTVVNAALGDPVHLFRGVPGYLLLIAAPAVVVVRQALLSRQHEGDAAWYPAGHLVSWIVGFAAVYFLVAALATSGSPGGLAGAIEDPLRALMEREEDAELAAETSETVEFMAGGLPAVAAIVWVFGVIINMALAQAILVRRRRNLRPSPVFSALEVPWIVMFPFVATLALAFVPGTLGFIGQTLAVIIAIPYFLVGLAVFHTVSRPWPMRELILGLVYVLTIAVFWFRVAFIMLGFVERWLKLRQRFAGYT